MHILAIESSCDETAVAVTRDGREVLADGLRGLLSASRPDSALIARVRGDIAYYDEQIEKLKEGSP